MKDPADRTKVVVRRLPPSISQPAVMEQIDAQFAGRYKWFSFRPGKNSHKNMRHSRVYIDFNSLEDVFEFSEFFDGHTFVNEKGTQFKVVVEYAPSQRTPKSSSKKDGREGTIYKDPEYLEFLQTIEKPVESLPSAEIQLERKEAERAGTKEAVIVTPLMEFVRQKRAARNGSQKLPTNVKLSRRALVSNSSSGSSSKRASDKGKAPTMYVLKDTLKGRRAKDKSAYVLVSRKEEQRNIDKSSVASSSCETRARKDLSESDSNGTGSLGSKESGKKNVLLLKSRDRDSSQASGTLVPQQNTAPSTGSSTTAKQYQKHDASGRLIRSILANKEGQSYAVASQSEQQVHANPEDKRPPRPPNTRLNLRDHPSSSSTFGLVSDSDSKRSVDDKDARNDVHSALPGAEKYDRRTRNKDRPDRGVWTPFRRSEGSSTDGTLSFEGVHSSQPLSGHKVGADDIGGRIGAENGSHRNVVHRALAHGAKESENLMSTYDPKPPKKVPSSYGTHEKQIWVQKSGSTS